MNEYDGIIFDNDGVLIEIVSGETLRQGIKSGFEEFDIEPSTEDIGSLMKPEDSEEIEEISRKYGLDVDELWETRERHVSEHQQRSIRRGGMSLYDDVEEGIRTVRELELGIVSTNQHRTIEFVVDYFGFGDVFSTYYGRRPTLEGYDKRKPDSYYVEKALDDMGLLETRNALFVGDSYVDVLAAEKANIDSAFLKRDSTTTTNEPFESEQVKPNYIIESLRELEGIV